MRTDCRHFESRTYATGDAVRSCKLGLAPEAPWRCPEGCASFAPRSVDVGWAHGTVATPAAPAPAGLDDGTAAALLGEVRDILDAAAPNVMSELDAERRGKGRRRAKRDARRGKKRGGE
ncbi:MAG: hypothetical protein ACKORC_07080 [Acidimicrobiia bacterium]